MGAIVLDIRVTDLANLQNFSDRNSGVEDWLEVCVTVIKAVHQYNPHQSIRDNSFRRPQYRRKLTHSVCLLKKRTFSLLVATTVFTFGGYYFFYSAVSVGSVAIASGITALQPSIVLLYSLVLSRIRPDWLPRGSDGSKGETYRKVVVVLIILGTWVMLAR
jgi:hypothetical protein